jgi:hypothetical protein
MTDSEFWDSVVLQCISKAANRPSLIADYADEMAKLRSDRFSLKEPVREVETKLPLEELGDIEDQIRYLHSDDTGDDE